jgi:hypothetical protein
MNIIIRGRTYDSLGKPSSATFKGGYIFVDHASLNVHGEHQVGFSASEAIRDKQGFERVCMDNGVVVPDYLTDSGAFKANTFVVHINETHQKLWFCGTNAYYQNSVAERAIQTFSNMVRAMILHSSIHWDNGCDSLSGPWRSHMRHTSTTTLLEMATARQTCSQGPLSLVTGSLTTMCGDAPCMSLLRKCRQGRKFQDGNSDQGVAYTWVSAHSTPVKCPKFST